MSLALNYIKSLQVAKTNEVLDSLLQTLKRQWPEFTQEEREKLLHTGKEARARINQPENDDVCEVPERALFEGLKAELASATSREQVQVIERRIDDLGSLGKLQRWQTMELFVMECAALRRIWETQPLNVSETTYGYLERLMHADRAGFDALLREVLPYSLELDRQGRAGDASANREWLIIEQAFMVRSEALKRQEKEARAAKKQAPLL
jgi:hypothetical protein